MKTKNAYQLIGKVLGMLLITFGCFPVNAQIVYTDIDPDSTISASLTEEIKSYYLDINNDGTDEFELRHFNPGAGSESVEFHGELIGDREVIVDANDHADVVTEGSSIGSGSAWGNDIYGILDSPWYGDGDKYFGLRFKISGQWHYAWARVQIPSDRLSFVVKDYAYNQTPGEAIFAGQKEISQIEEPFGQGQNLISIFPNPFNSATTIKFSREVNNVEISIFNSYGQKMKAVIQNTGDQLILKREDLASGVYFYQLNPGNDKIYTGTFIIVD